MNTSAHHELERRDARRYPIIASGRMLWTDANGAAHSASIRSENVSELGLLVECFSSTEIPLHRLVGLSLSLPAGALTELPNALRQRDVQAAIYRSSRRPTPPSRRDATRCVCSLPPK